MFLFQDNHVRRIPHRNIPQRKATIALYIKYFPPTYVASIATLTVTTKHYNIIKDVVSCEHLDQDTTVQLNSLLHHYNDIFCLEEDELTVCPILQHNIELYTDSPIINVKQFRRSQWENEQIDKHIAKLLRDGIIQPSVSPYITVSVVTSHSRYYNQYCISSR